jgi:hypothetical protein
VPTGSGHVRAARPALRENRSRAVRGRTGPGTTVAAPAVAADATGTAPPVAAGLVVAATRQDVAHEAGERAGQGHALHEEGDVEAHQATLPWLEFPARAVTSLRLLAATSP